MTDNPVYHGRSDEALMRMADILICLALLPFLLVMLPLCAVGIVLDDGFPVFFRQLRVGRNCATFEIYKFRTMQTDPERASGDAPEGVDLTAQRARFKTASKHDHRITRVGRVLRKTHLDELPQILNVLTGDMSLVGVRPDVPVQEADYTPEDWLLRHRLRPGITGLAQVDEGANEYHTVRRERDIEWVNGHSFLLYCKILGKTVRKVTERTGV